ncbi:MAG: restriction endonuclease subunit S, partial [Oceanobacter sp.]
GKDRKIEPNEMAVLKVSAVSYGVFDSAAAKVVDGEELGRAKTNPKQGQIIISRSNTEELVGASAYVDADHPDRFLPDKLWQTVPKLDSDMKWLSYVLASDHSRYTLSNLATGTSGSMKNITKGELLGFKVLIPPLPEQKKIAQILSTWDKAITTTEQRLTNSQQQKKALMQQLLTGKQRLLDQNGERFKGEWLRNSLKDLVEIIYGKSPKEVVSPTGSYPIYGTGGIGGFASEPLCEEIAVLIGRKGTIDKPPYISEPFWAIDRY